MPTTTPFTYLVEAISDTTSDNLVQHTLEVPDTDSIKHINDAVGGYFDVAFTVPGPKGAPHMLTGYVNDEGLINRMPVHLAVRYPNGYVNMLAGPMVLQGVDYESGESTSLTDEDIAFLKARRTVMRVFPYENYLFTNVVFYDFLKPDEEDDA